MYKRQGYIPHELIKGTPTRGFWNSCFNYPPESEKTDVSIKIRLANENLLSKGERRKRRHDAKGKWMKYEIGQLVLVRRHDLSSAQDKEIKKFFLLYEGPYEVIEVKKNNAYVLQNRETMEIIGTHNATNLKVYWSS